MKMMQGAFFLACSNMSRTREAPTPTNISTKSEPEMVKNGTLASPAMDLASRHATGDAATQLLELLRVTQEIDQLLHFFLGFVATGDIGEGDGVVGFVEHAGAALAEAERTALATALHLTHEVDPHADQQQHRGSSRGLTSNLTPLLMRSPTRPRSR
ncbi:unnamed protein product [Victoria cruziana]